MSKKSGEVLPYGFRVMQADRQTNRHTRYNTSTSREMMIAVLLHRTDDRDYEQLTVDY